MSKVYTNAAVLCSCTSVDVDETSKLPTAVVDSELHLGDVYFCPSCQKIKCENCCNYGIECKYCPNCLANYSDSNDIVCTKNCFDCPLCDNTLSISVSDEKLNGKLGKLFKFTCLFCNYKYHTDVITKPKSLRNIIRGELKKSPFFQLYGRVQENLGDNSKLDSLSDATSTRAKAKPKLSENILQRLKYMEMTNVQKDTFNEIDVLRNKLNTKNEGVTIDIELIDIEAAKTRSSCHIYEKNVSITRYLKQNQTVNTVPLSKPLMAKKSHRCGTCNTPLVVPAPDPLLLKFLCKWNAIDFVPNVIVSNVIDKSYPTTLRSNHLQSFIINIINPLLHDLKVSMSILSKLPQKFISSQNYSVQLSLPVTEVTVGSEYDKTSIIKSIPTPLLTKATKQSRAELLMRLGKLNTSNKSISPDDSLDIETTLIERGNNWVLLPFSIVCTRLDVDTAPKDETIELKVPFYIIVESKLPESIKALGQSKRGLKYGFWTVVNLGNFTISWWLG